MRLKIKIFLSKVINSSFIKNIFVLMTGTAVAQVIGFSLSPIISRLYTPADFGVFGSFDAVLNIITAGVTLEYSQAMMLPKEKEDAAHLFVISCLSTIGITIIFCVLCVLATGTLMSLTKLPNNFMLSLLAAAILINGMNRAFQAWCVRVKAFKHTSASQVIRSLSSNCSQIGFGFLNGGASSLVISTVLANVLASINLFRVSLTDLKAHWSSITWKKLKALGKEYHDFPLYSASQNVINAFSSGLPVLLLTHYFGIEVAGAYAFGVRLLQVPMSFVLAALRQVLFQKAGETQHQGGKLSPLYIKVTLGLVVISIVPALILIIWAPHIFSFIFGSKWSIAGDYARYLVIWLVVVFCNLPAVLFSRLIRIQRFVFCYDIILLIARIAILVICGIYFNALQTIIMFSMIGAFMNVLLILIVGYFIINREGYSRKTLWTELFGNRVNKSA